MNETKKKCIVFKSSNLQDATLQKLAANFEVLHFDSPIEISRVCDDVEFAFISPGYFHDAKFLTYFPKLRYVASNSTSLSHLDIELFESKNIEIFSLVKDKEFLETVTPTSELALALALLISRNLVSAIESTRVGDWNRNNFISQKMFSRMKIGVIGLGRLGSRFANYCSAMGASVSFYDPCVDNSHYQKVELKKLLIDSDLVSIHATPNKDFPLYLDLDLLSLLRSTSFIVNTSRSEFIDHRALLFLLKSKRLSGVALDVVPSEYGHYVNHEGVTQELFDFARENRSLVLTPHIGGSTSDARNDTESFVADRLVRRVQVRG